MPPAPPPLPGWARTLAGQRLDYHSSYPDVRRALVCRAMGEPLAIAWQTAPAPVDGGDRAVVFRWLAGLATGKGAHRFTLTVGGRATVAFRTDGARSWSVAAARGLRLDFATAMVDRFGELFGHMDLTVPRALVRPGEGLDLRLAGEDARSQDWCLVFEHTLADWVRAEAEGALLRGGDGPRQPVRVEVSRLGPPTTASIRVGGGAATTVHLTTGFNELRLPVPPVAAPATLSVAVDVAAGEPAQALAVEQRPVPYRELWLLPHSHLDIGYTDLQEAVERRHWQHLATALALARETRDLPRGERFCWNVEQLWAIETWWRQAAADQRRALVEAARAGEVGLQALLAGVLTGLCHPRELDRLTDFARELAAAAGLVIDTAMITDIPGQTWTLVPALARAGVRYLASGPNYMPGLPDGGDRVGGFLRTWGDRPVWWQSASGRERVLLWTAGRGYSWFHGLGGALLDPDRPRAVMDYLRDLETKAYPYEMVQVRYTVGGDNGPPDAALPGAVRAWNARYETPRLVMATASEMFAEFERRHGAAIPTVRGDLTPYWEDGAASSARETAMNRASANRLAQAEALWRIVDPDGPPTADLAAAWRLVVLFSEHTWGAAESVRRPDAPHVRAQWSYKRGLAEAADRASRDLLERALAIAAGRCAPAEVLVLNTLDHPRGEVVTVTAAGEHVVDDDGVETPSQRLADGRLAFLAADVASLGARRFRVRQGPAAAPPVPVRAADLTLQNERLQVTVDPASGAIASLVWLARDLELVDRSRWPGLNAYVYVAGRDPTLAAGAGETSVRVGERGPLVASLIIESAAPGARSLRCELRLAAGSDRLEIVDVIDKLPVRTPESVHLAFPFRVAGGQVRVDLGGALVRPDRDQLAGACRDWFCAHSGVVIDGLEASVAWITRDAPLVEVGALTDERPGPGGTRTWRREVGPGQTLFSYAMNNYWHTNYRAEQEGPVTLRYAIQVAVPGCLDAAAVGAAASQPLLAVQPAAAPLNPTLESR